MNISYYDLYYTAIKNRDEKESLNDEYENNDNDYFLSENFLTPNHHIRRKNNNEILTYRNLRS